MVTFRKRNGPNRLFLLLTMSTFLWVVMPWFGEVAVAYFYVQTRYGWKVAEYSQYVTVTSIISLIGIEIRSFYYLFLQNDITLT